MVREPHHERVGAICVALSVSARCGQRFAGAPGYNRRVLDAYPVSAICRYLKELLESDLRLSNMWVEGEITNLSRSQRGHVYFTLKEGAYQLRCVMFQRQHRGMPLESGAQVLTHGNLNFYAERGDVQIIVDFVQPAGVGARRAELERLKTKLEDEGLFDEARKRPLPEFPVRIGVVTSPAGAVFHDICNVLARRWREHDDSGAAHKLVTSHLRLVAKIAMGSRGYGLPVNELISEGNVGMMQAVKRFEPDRGFRLATYAMWWIRAAIQEYILRSW